MATRPTTAIGALAESIPQFLDSFDKTTQMVQSQQKRQRMSQYLGKQVATNLQIMQTLKTDSDASAPIFGLWRGRKIYDQYFPTGTEEADTLAYKMSVAELVPREISAVQSSYLQMQKITIDTVLDENEQVRLASAVDTGDPEDTKKVVKKRTSNEVMNMIGPGNLALAKDVILHSIPTGGSVKVADRTQPAGYRLASYRESFASEHGLLYYNDGNGEFVLTKDKGRMLEDALGDVETATSKWGRMIARNEVDGILGRESRYDHKEMEEAAKQHAKLTYLASPDLQQQADRNAINAYNAQSNRMQVEIAGLGLKQRVNEFNWKKGEINRQRAFRDENIQKLFEINREMQKEEDRLRDAATALADERAEEIDAIDLPSKSIAGKPWMSLVPTSETAVESVAVGDGLATELVKTRTFGESAQQHADRMSSLFYETADTIEENLNNSTYVMSGDVSAMRDRMQLLRWYASRVPEYSVWQRSDGGGHALFKKWRSIIKASTPKERYKTQIEMFKTLSTLLDTRAPSAIEREQAKAKIEAKGEKAVEKFHKNTQKLKELQMRRDMVSQQLNLGMSMEKSIANSMRQQELNLDRAKFEHRVRNSGGGSARAAGQGTISDPRVPPGPDREVHMHNGRVTYKGDDGQFRQLPID